MADASRIIDPGRSAPRRRAPDARTEGAEGPNASVEGRVEALAPEESDTKPSTWHRGLPEGVSTTCPVDVRATCSALPRFEKKTSHGRMVGVCEDVHFRYLCILLPTDRCTRQSASGILSILASKGGPLSSQERQCTCNILGPRDTIATSKAASHERLYQRHHGSIPVPSIESCAPKLNPRSYEKS